MTPSAATASSPADKTTVYHAMVTTPATEETAGEAANVDPALTLKSIR